MGKIKSAIITAIIALATLALFLFGVISCSLPGGVNRYNSILASINLGAELSGDAYSVLLPEGVISAEEYDFTVAEEGEEADDMKQSYTQAPGGSFYVENTLLNSFASDGTADTAEERALAFEELSRKIAADADIVAARLSGRNLTSYSVGVLGGYALRVAVPTNFSYAAYSGNDTGARSEYITTAGTTISHLSLGGELTLRNNEYGVRDRVSAAQNAAGTTETRNILGATLRVEDIFQSVTYYAMGGTYAVRINLTEQGAEEISRVSAYIADTSTTSDQTIRFYVGETSVIDLTCESQITGRSFYIQCSTEDLARDYAALLNSAATGNSLEYVYEYNDIVYQTTPGGENTAMFLAIAALAVLAVIIVAAVVRYRGLGATFALMSLLFAGAMIAIVYLVGVTLTTMGVFMAVMCYMLFAGCNFWSFEQIRRESDAGRTIQAAVKTGYKKTFTGILDMHIVLLVVSVLLTLICGGELAACGMIMLIGTLASYLLHWFTRFSWYVTMSLARDKYKFCGFSREAFDEDE